MCCLAQETTLYGTTIKIHEPVGVIGIACPDRYPLLGFVSLFAPAVVRGNTMVIIPSEKHPLVACDLYQVRVGVSPWMMIHSWVKCTSMLPLLCVYVFVS